MCNETKGKRALSPLKGTPISTRKWVKDAKCSTQSPLYGREGGKVGRIFGNQRAKGIIAPSRFLCQFQCPSPSILVLLIFLLLFFPFFFSLHPSLSPLLHLTCCPFSQPPSLPARVGSQRWLAISSLSLVGLSRSQQAVQQTSEWLAGRI